MAKQVRPKSFGASQSGLDLLMFRLAAQERAGDRLRTRAATYATISLAIWGFYVGILNADAESTLSTLPCWKMAGAIALSALFLLMGGLFIWIHRPGSVAVAPEPENINETMWAEGKAAVWNWAYTLEQAIQENRSLNRREETLSTCALITVSIQGLLFGGLTLADIFA